MHLGWSKYITEATIGLGGSIKCNLLVLVYIFNLWKKNENLAITCLIFQKKTVNASQNEGVQFPLFYFFQNKHEWLNSWIDLSYQHILKLILEYLKMSHENRSVWNFVWKLKGAGLGSMRRIEYQHSHSFNAYICSPWRQLVCWEKYLSLIYSYKPVNLDTIWN